MIVREPRFAAGFAKGKSGGKATSMETFCL